MDYILGDHIPGWGTSVQHSLLAKLASEINENGCIVELGSFLGKSAYALGMNKLPSVKLYCVDRWSSINKAANTLGGNSPPQGGDTSQIYSLESFKENMAEVKNLHVIHAELPYDEDKIKFEEDIDLLYIDADHTYEGVKSNIKQWCGKVKPGGTIIFDDYTDEWSGVKQAVNEYATDNNLWDKLINYHCYVIFKLT